MRAQGGAQVIAVWGLKKVGTETVFVTEKNDRVNLDFANGVDMKL